MMVRDFEDQPFFQDTNISDLLKLSPREVPVIIGECGLRR